MGTREVFGRACPQCHSTTTIRIAGPFDRRVWQCRACRARFEVPPNDGQWDKTGQASLAEVERQADPSLSNVQCPHCGFGVGLYLAPKEKRTPATPVRCLSCRGHSPIERWQTRE